MNVPQNVVWHHATVSRQLRGKSILACAVQERMHSMGCCAFVFDGDNVCNGLCRDLGFSLEDQAENLRRIAEMVKLFLGGGDDCTLRPFLSLEMDRRETRQSRHTPMRNP